MKQSEVQGWHTLCDAGDLLLGFVSAGKCRGCPGSGASWHGGAPVSTVGSITLQIGLVTSQLVVAELTPELGQQLAWESAAWFGAKHCQGPSPTVRV